MSHRFWPACFICLVASAPVRADAYDWYVNATLAKASASDKAQEIKELTPRLVGVNGRALPGVSGAFLIVKTNEARWAKLLVQAARQKVDAEKSIPMLLVDRFTTYKEGEERTIQASGKNVSLFNGFRLSLDLGQVVPEELGGDLRFVVDGDKIFTQPVGKAQLWLLTESLPDVAPKKGPKLVVGEKFDPAYYNGSYKLYDDGRRSGTLTLKLEDEGVLTGSYYSDKDGQKYEVRGKVGSPTHAASFTIVFPRVEQSFSAWLFTGDGKALTGVSRLADREAGFYAVRVEE
jgi:hypothetical protein